MKIKLIILCLFFAVAGWSQVIWTNPITGSDPGLTSPYTTGQTVVPNITVSGISRGAGVAGNVGDNRYNANGWATATTLTLTNNDYFEFTITPNAGYRIDFESFTYTGKASNTGPKSFSLRSSITATPYATAIGVANELGTTISLSDPLYQNRTAATTFRFYGWNASAAAGTFSINDFTFNANVSVTCTSTVITSVTPTSGPVGTQVSINAASGLTGATATFEGVSATVVSALSTDTKLVVLIPAGATTGSLIVKNAAACPSIPIPYAVIKEDRTGCGSGSLNSDLFISEIADSSVGSLSYIEIMNNTGATKNLSNYKIKFAQNGGAYGATLYSIGTTTLAQGSTVVIAIDSGTLTCSTVGGDGSYASILYTTSGLGLGFDSGGCDHVGLFNTTISSVNPIDSFGVFGNDSWVSPANSLEANGADFKRKNTVTAPNPVYSNSDWTIINFPGTTTASCASNDYSDIGKYDALKNAPTLVSSTNPTISCPIKSINIEVSATEGIVGAPGLAYQWYIAAPGATSFTALANGGVYSGVTTFKLTISSIIGLDNYQYYCQIREDLGTCYTASNAYIIKDIPTATWSGSWSPSAPTSTMRAVFNTSYSTSVNNIEACSCDIKSPAVLTITTGKYVEIQNDITNAGTIDIQNNGSLIQVDDTATINGLTKVTRDTTPYEAYDFTYWSSPITAAVNSTAFSNFRYDHTYSFLTVNYSDPLGLGHDNAPPSPWINEAASAVLTPGRGYIVRGSSAAGAFPRTTSAHFDGILNNGVITVPVTLSGDNIADSDDYNLVGNPYASAISADKFIDLNTNTSGTLYFWTHVDNISTAYAWSGYAGYSSDDYAVYTKLGGTGTRGPIVVPGDPTSGSTAVPAGSIASGQGFFIKYNGPTPSSTITFNNSLRSKSNDNTQFYKAHGNPDAKDRIWLNLQNPARMFSQQLIGYVPDGTIGYDRGYDGLFNNGGNYINFYSLSESEKYKIQARPSFNVQDVVALGYSTIANGPFEISIDNKEGVFENIENVYIEDRLLNVIHDLKQSPYSFTTESGTFNDRFVLKYKNQSLGNETIGDAGNEVSIVSASQKVTVHAVAVPIKQVAIFDVLGRKIYDSGTISQYEFTADHIINSQQALIVKVILENDRQVTKKIIY